MHRIALNGLAGSVSLVLAAVGSAATFQVDSVADVGDREIDGECSVSIFADGFSFVEVCTLRAAVDEANATSEPDIIVLPPGTYPLTRAAERIGRTSRVLHHVR